MKFAVIEYSSKSGKIWMHTDAKPNYVADPDKEIDPTSFGCYVSALSGQHIPLKGFLTGSVIPTSPLQVYARRIYKKFLGHWPTGYDISFFSQFDMVMIVHQISDGHEVTTFTKKLRSLSKRPYIIGVPTQPFGILEEYFIAHPDFLSDMKTYMDACDVFITLAASTKDTWQAMTKTPVVYLPQPYPSQYAATFAQGLDGKKPIIFVAGVTERKNVSLGQEVAAHLQKNFPEYDIHITETPGHTQNTKALHNARFSVQPFLPWQEQLKYLSNVRLVINTDFTQTRGRVQVDCAAVGTASIGADSDAQRDLFPDFYADEKTSFHDLVVQGTKLLTDDALYKETIEKAQKQMTTYDYEQSKTRLLELPTKYPIQMSPA